MSIYKRILEEHWLRDKQAEGVALILEDDSTWEIHPSDRSITARWLRGSTIYVEDKETNGHRYVLRNHTEGEAARATFLGQFRAAV